LQETGKRCTIRLSRGADTLLTLRLDVIMGWSWNRSIRGGYGLLCLAALAAPPAQAAAGDHIRVGDAELVPALTAGAQYQSNPRLSESPQPEDAGVNVNVRPELQANLDGNDARMSAWASYKATKYISEDLWNLDNYGDIDTGLDLDLAPKAVVGFKLQGGYTVTGYPTGNNTGDSSLFWKRQGYGAGFVAVHPGAALSADVGGGGGYDQFNFPAEAGAELAGLDNGKVSYGPKVNLKWTFFPKTAFVANFAYTWFDYSQNVVDATGSGDNAQAQDIGDYGVFPGGTHLQVLVGLRGRFTERLVLNVMSSYSPINYDETTIDGANAAEGVAEANAEGQAYLVDAKGLDALPVTADLSWTPRSGVTMTAGYVKSVQDSVFTNYVAYHHGFARLQVLVGSRTGFGVDGGVRLEKYQGEVTRNDVVPTANGGITYNVADWLDAGVDAGWERRVNSEGNGYGEYDNFKGGASLTFTY